MKVGRTCGSVVAAALSAAACAPDAGAVELPVGCAGGTGDAGGLVLAVNQANALPGDDTIVLGNGCRYELTTPHNNWYGPNGLPPIASRMTIEGHGSTIARAAAAPKFRLIFVGANATGTAGYVTPGPGDLTLHDLTLENGLARGGDAFGGGGGAGMGGAIFSQGTVLIERSTFVGNAAQGGSAANNTVGPGGGGIGTDAPASGNGGGFGAGTFGGAAGGTGGNGGGGGGGGFLAGDTGGAATPTVPGAGGGTTTGLAGPGGSAGGAGGNGGAGGAKAPGGGAGTAGGGFSAGAVSGGLLQVGGGGGVGGGGAFGGAGGGGGFGAGGGGSGNNALPTPAGTGGFGGGAGAGAGSVAGFAGGTGSAALGGGGAGLGGAIFNMQARLEIRNSTFTQDAATGGGATGPATAGQGLGGAIFNLSGELKLLDATLAANTAAQGGSSIYNLVYDTSTFRDSLATLRDTIVANGTGFNDLISDKPATVVGGGANQGRSLAVVAEFDLVTTLLTKGTGEVFGAPLFVDPKLGPLADNGGPTRTLAPAPDSPVIDAGSAEGLTTDQRGRTRPFDVAAIANPTGGDGSDIGAYERQGGEFPTTTTTTTTTTTDGGGGGGTGTATGTTPLNQLGIAGLAAFGDRTLVTLSLASKRVARGRVSVAIANANGFAVNGDVGVESPRAIAAKKRKKRVVTSATTAFTVAAGATTTASVALPRALAKLLARKGKLALRLRATVHDPASTARTVTASASAKRTVKRKRRA
jgi:hypothetical protein